MPFVPNTFSALALSAGVVDNANNFLFLQTGASGTLDLYLSSVTGVRALFTLNTKVLLDGTGVPGSSTGGTGDYFISSDLLRFYGPKTSGSWPSTYASLSGARGATGVTGATGATGQVGTGVAPSGYSGQILAKNSSTNYDTSWFNVNSISKDSRDGLGAYSFCYKNSHLRNGAGAYVSNIGSDCVFCPNTNTLFVIENNATISLSLLHEFYLDGTWKKTISLTSFVDVESIDWAGANDSGSINYFYVGEEYDDGAGTRYARITKIAVERTTTNIDRTTLDAADKYDLTSITFAANLGVEALCYYEPKDVVYFILEKDPGTWGVYELNLTTQATTVRLFAPTGDFAVTDVSSMCINRKNDSFYFLSQESNKIIEMSISGLTPMSYRETDQNTQLEGITISADSESLILTGEQTPQPSTSTGSDIYIYRKNSISPFNVDRQGNFVALLDEEVNYIPGKRFEAVSTSLLDESFVTVYRSMVPANNIGTLTLSSGYYASGKAYELSAFGSLTTDPVLNHEFILQLNSDYIHTNVIPITAAASFNWQYNCKIVMFDAGYSATSEFKYYIGGTGYGNIAYSQSGYSFGTTGYFDLVHRETTGSGGYGLTLGGLSMKKI